MSALTHLHESQGCKAVVGDTNAVQLHVREVRRGTRVFVRWCGSGGKQQSGPRNIMRNPQSKAPCKPRLEETLAGSR